MFNNTYLLSTINTTYIALSRTDRKRQTHRQTDRQTESDREIHGQTDRKTESDRQTHRQTD